MSRTLVHARKMHVDEVATNVPLVRRLIAEQFPQWADLPVALVDAAGTDNVLYRLGQDMAVRLPRVPSAVGQVDKEHHWLPRLAPLLPLAIPKPVARGVPADGYPWHWSVYLWLGGENASVEPIGDLRHAAIDLAHFVRALRRVEPVGGPPGRGRRLEPRDRFTRAAIGALRGTIDVDAVTAVWEECLRAPAWEAPPVWTHGDLIPTNLLVARGRISAVIDFGCVGVADPACDLIVAWSLLSADTREDFRTALAVDDSTWLRGRGWALSQALMIVPYYRRTNPVLVSVAERMIAEVLGDR